MIIPGILEKSLAEIIKKVELVQNVSQIIQIDVADGILVEGESFRNVDKLDNLQTTAGIELHLMVKDPLSYVNYQTINIKKMLVQIEAEHVREFLQFCEQLGFDLGLSISPDTPNSELESYLHLVDYVQFMGVVPGAQGREFEPKVLEKIKEFRIKHPNVVTQVDGHMDEKTIAMVKPLNVNHYVVGSAIFSSEDPAAQKEALENLIN
jgi:ribulose-phosphate 3-epimerase